MYCWTCHRCHCKNTTLLAPALSEFPPALLDCPQLRLTALVGLTTQPRFVDWLQRCYYDDTQGKSDYLPVGFQIGQSKSIQETAHWQSCLLQRHRAIRKYKPTHSTAETRNRTINIACAWTTKLHGGIPRTGSALEASFRGYSQLIIFDNNS